eukprot:TRINITY_DN7920_c0_g1_i2.p1 TRINITY_DN7920_c0_g1~~TRINITY_DN7920_c0_g1_i2.p1  ORF type:complete len:243 (+),score=47.61 TRINITY_DN7920_c0_g1_i2:163-891(+)
MCIRDRLKVLIEVDVGQGRCGVRPGADCADLAVEVDDCEWVELVGLQCYSGWNQHVKDLAERKGKSQEVVQKVLECLQEMKSNKSLTITGAGTGSYIFEAQSGVYTEIQPGSYSVMDQEYRCTDPVDSEHYEHALFVGSTVVSDSSTHPGWLVVDAGDKAISAGAACVVIAGHADLSYRRGGDEHGIVEGPADQLDALPIGTQLMLIPGHCDPTINFYNEYLAVENETVVQVIPIDAAGPGR